MNVRHHLLRLLARIILAIGLSVIDGSWANADDLATIKERGMLIVGVKTDYPPFGFRSPSGEIEGLEPELARYVARTLGVKLELVPVVASNRIELLEQGKIDLIIATMNGTMLRRAAVEIVKPHYYAAGYNVMALKVDAPHLVGRTEGQAGMRHRGRLLQLCSGTELRASNDRLHRYL